VFRGELTTRALRRRFLATSGALIVVIVVATAASVTEGYSTHRYAQHWTSAPVAGFVPTPAEQAATLSATVAYRRLIVTTAEDFSVAASNLVTAIARDDVTGARDAYLRAQGDYDVLRPTLSAQASSSSSIDALVIDQVPAAPAVGLHAIERDLWSSTPQSATALAPALSAQASIMPFLVSRTILTPAEICASLSELLGWTVENAIDSSQERYSHLDLVDVRAAARAAAVMVSAVAPIGALVDAASSAQLTIADGQLAALCSRLPPSEVDTAVPSATWTDVSYLMDVVVARSGQLAGALAGLGTGRSYA